MSEIPYNNEQIQKVLSWSDRATTQVHPANVLGVLSEAAQVIRQLIKERDELIKETLYEKVCDQPHFLIVNKKYLGSNDDYFCQLVTELGPIGDDLVVNLTAGKENGGWEEELVGRLIEVDNCFPSRWIANNPRFVP